ncbi:MAG: hypothetical protein GEU68_15895 [Actinobacteria bacterium]|nr:hypothetical protein [Actinomycetota bacterium]
MDLSRGLKVRGPLLEVGEVFGRHQNLEAGGGAVHIHLPGDALELVLALQDALADGLDLGLGRRDRPTKLVQSRARRPELLLGRSQLSLNLTEFGHGLVEIPLGGL